MVFKWSLHHHQGGYSKVVRHKQLQTVWLLVLLSLRDYKRLSTRLYFISTNFHTELNLRLMSAMVWILQHLPCTGVGRGSEGGIGPSLDFEMWRFLIKGLAKKSCFLSFEWKKWNFNILGLLLEKYLASPGKVHSPFEKILPIPCIQRLINHGQLVNHTA